MEWRWNRNGAMCDFYFTSLNPCSNGMALELNNYDNILRSCFVLILVLMEWRWNI